MPHLSSWRDVIHSAVRIGSSDASVRVCHLVLDAGGSSLPETGEHDTRKTQWAAVAQLRVRVTKADPVRGCVTPAPQ
ncbi:hypothetical protein E2C01_087421 [Portunus trituberculatus]|uniref:Uncharacterized protein n=1 Tax=Portunus trituberculatus TaxID=210409 RepID=A0A5B7JH91_PORTR|nr:hypothetical protein [Portunus trituberculatus]